VQASLTGFIEDAEIVLMAFIVMTGAFCAQRIGSSLWQPFLADLSAQLHMSVMPHDAWM
jgi:hypothetical protein